MARGSRDAGTKIDQPSDKEGMAGGVGKNSMEAEQAAQEMAQEQAEQSATAPEPKPKKRKPATKKSEGTAAAETGVDKPAAEAALSEGSSEAPAKPKRARAKKANADAPAAEAKTEAKPKRKPKAETAAAEAPAETATPEAQPEPAAAKTPAPASRSRRRNGKQADSRVTVRAQAKYVRTSARKARLVAEHVRGKPVDEARAILAHASRAVAEDWRKLLESAIANAEHNHDLVGDDLRVLHATADEGPTLKRFRPRAMGRASRIRKRTSHLTITLTPKE